MVLNYLTIAFVCIAGPFAQAAGNSGFLEEFLKSAWQSRSVEARKVNMINQADDRVLNPIEKLQLRASTTNSEKEERSFGLRLSPMGFNEFRHLQSLHEQNSRIEKINYERQLGNDLEARYLAYLNYASAYERVQTSKRLKDLAKREAQMTATASRSSSNAASNVLRAQVDEQESEIRLAEDESALASALITIRSFDHQNGSIKKSALPTADQLPSARELEAMYKKLLPMAQQLKDEKPSSVMLGLERASRARTILHYNQERDSKIVDYIELKMSEDRRERIYGFEVAFNIPFLSGESYENRERSRQMIDYEIDVFTAERDFKVHSEFSRSSLKSSIELCRLSASEEDPNLQGRLKKLARKEDPLLALSLEQNEVNRKRRQREICDEAIKKYLSFISTMDLFVKRPTVNYLSTQLQEFSL